MGVLGFIHEFLWKDFKVLGSGWKAKDDSEREKSFCSARNVSSINV